VRRWGRAEEELGHHDGEAKGRYANSLKTTHETMGKLDEKLCQVTKKADKVKREVAVWKVEAEAGKIDLTKYQDETAEREKTLSTKLEKC